MLFIMLYKVLVTFESQKHSGSPGGGYSHLQAVWVCAAVKGVAFTSFALSSAEAPVSEHQRKKREREKTGAGENGSAGDDGKREKALIFPLPSLRAPRVLFSQAATVGGLCGGES